MVKNMIDSLVTKTFGKMTKGLGKGLNTDNVLPKGTSKLVTPKMPKLLGGVDQLIPMRKKR